MNPQCSVSSLTSIQGIGNWEVSDFVTNTIPETDHTLGETVPVTDFLRGVGCLSTLRNLLFRPDHEEGGK